MHLDWCISPPEKDSVSSSVFCWHLNTAFSFLSFLRNPPDLQEVWLFPASLL